MLVRRNAYAAVGDGNPQALAIVTTSGTDVDIDKTTVGKLHGIAGQIEQNPLKTLGIRFNQVRDIIRNLPSEVQRLLTGLGLKNITGSRDKLGD